MHWIAFKKPAVPVCMGACHAATYTVGVQKGSQQKRVTNTQELHRCLQGKALRLRQPRSGPKVGGKRGMPTLQQPKPLRKDW